MVRISVEWWCDGERLEVLGYSCFDIHYCFYYFLVVVGARNNFGCEVSRRKIIGFHLGTVHGKSDGTPNPEFSSVSI